MAYNSAKDITNLYLYGQNTTPSDKLSDTLIRPNSVTPPVYNVSKQDFMTNGGGRFALGPQFEIVQKFFSPSYYIPEGEYSKSEMAAYFGMSAIFWSMSQYDFKDSKGYADFAERTYIYNTMAFKIVDDATFIVAQDGSRTIANFAVEPLVAPQNPENFDMEGGNYLTNILNIVLETYIDPSHLGRKVNIEFTGGVTPTAYVQYDYDADLATMSTWETPSLATLGVEMNKLIDALWNSGEIKFLSPDNKPLIYGSNNGDVLAEALIGGVGYPLLEEYVDNGVVLIGGKGGDFLTGGDQADSLLGGAANDLLWSKKGNDTLEGGDGADTYVFATGDGADTVNDTGPQDMLYLGGNLFRGEAVKTGTNTYTLDGYNLTKSGSTMTITHGSDAVTLTNWEEGDYGITLQQDENQPNAGPGIIWAGSSLGWKIFPATTAGGRAANDNAPQINQIAV